MQKSDFDTINDKKVWRRATAHLKKRDAVLGEVIERVGDVKLEWGPDHYEALVRSFISQQISGSAADSIYNKFTGLYNGKLPTPKEFLKTPEKKIRSVGISPQKYSYIKDLSQRMERGTLSLEGMRRLPDEEVIVKLDEVKGIGRWTAEMFLMFSLGRVNVFPADDLGIQKAIQKAYRLRKLPSKDKMGKLSKEWNPYRSIATIYLWRSIETKKK